jgi:hypothetical protein
MSIQGVACVTDGADTLVHRDREALHIVTWWLVDGYVIVMSPRGCALAGVELTSPGHRALRLLHRHTLEQWADLALGPTVFRCCRLW